ncbi:Ectonucleotide pyrophosphatase/phosphodiesterase family member 7 [Holothuria leucospilota]|uniref:Ectonucleotide pyrophosphatase/phosphodiesterase family member 7 n=1 Tax=Holothuria leucospilota TaxID=206669 RepID=A0A9Q1BU38_HOLLE|nr:Ectonucleotide pyrophosphatase/phosphodiesterase family member 7 [Holothuria leucospilota]
MNVNSFLHFVLFASCMPSTDLSKDGTKQKVILLLSDGLRWDRFGVDVPNLDQIEKNGVRADWLDGVFITMTMPSTYSIATGLYPESHGVVNNAYFNKTTKERTFKFVDTLNITEWFDTGVEPMWVTAKNAGKRVGSILYIGSWLSIKGVQPDRVIPLSTYFWDNYGMRERVRDAVNWISGDLDLVLLYFNYPDFVLHSYPIENEHSIQSVKDVDEQIGYLFQLIDQRGLSDEVNVIIVSDHGFVDMDPRKFIRLYDYIDESDVDFIIDYGPALFQLAPVEGKLEKVYQALKIAHPALHVYKKEEFPERLHYANHPRNLPIIGFVDPEWHIHKVKLYWNPTTDEISGGNHGYDNRWMSMKSSFYAQGPFFKKGYRARPLESVDIYGMVCEILDIPPAPNNGSRDRYVDMIRSGGANLTPRLSVSSFFFLVISVFYK